MEAGGQPKTSLVQLFLQLHSNIASQLPTRFWTRVRAAGRVLVPRSSLPQAAVKAVAAGRRVLGAQDHELVVGLPIFFSDASNAPPVVKRLVVPKVELATDRSGVVQCGSIQCRSAPRRRTKSAHNFTTQNKKKRATVFKSFVHSEPSGFTIRMQHMYLSGMCEVSLYRTRTCNHPPTSEEKKSKKRNTT